MTRVRGRTATIRIGTETRASLARLKSSSHETCDEPLRKLIALVPEGDDEGLYTQAFRRGLLEARLDIIESRLVSHRETKRRLGL